MTFIGAGHTEFYAVIVIRLGGRGKIEFRERNLLRMLWREYPHHLSNDGVVSYFLLVLITENEHGRLGSFRALGLAWRRRRGARIYILVGLLAHLLFREALLVHLIGQADLILLILIVGGTGVPPPVGIDSAAQVRISITPTAAVSIPVTIAPKSRIGAESQTDAGTIEGSGIPSASG